MNQFRQILPKNRPHPLRKIAVGQIVRECLPRVALGFLLAAVNLRAEPMPIAVAYVASMPMGGCAVAAAIGAIGGYLVFCEGIDAAVMTAAVLLMLAASALFHGTHLPATRLFLPLMCAGVCGILGAVCGLGGGAQWWLLAVRCLVAAVVTFILREKRPFSVETELSERQRLKTAAEILEDLAQQLPTEPLPPSVSEAAGIYDGTTERICRCCPRFHRCWQHRAQETYHALSEAARRILERGTAHAEDFPQSFRSECCHMDGFLTALNQELEGMLFRRRYRMQLRESRQVVAEEFSCVAEYLRAARRTKAPTPARFQPDIGICTVGKNGSDAIGDRGACFRGRGTDYFVLLCDGMGTGREASSLSDETMRLLQRLLRSGVAPESALKILNGRELLRGTGCFTTVDLLCVDLADGTAMLYKWGAAPSYLRTQEQVARLGSATPPPGVGVGGDRLPQCSTFSLRRGELLVLVSDGARREDTEERIAAFQGRSPRELAALLITRIDAEDDMTAVCLCLKPV